MSNLLLTKRPAAPANNGPASDVLELRVTTPGLPPKIARVADRTISLGAGPRCTVQLSAPGLRPMHCLITRTDTGLSVRRWANNTLLNGRSFSEAPLTSGDRLSIGDCLVEIHAPNTNEVFAEPIAEQQDEPIAAVDEAAEMIAADLALDEPTAAMEPAPEPLAVGPPRVAPNLERASQTIEPITPSPVEVVPAGSRALTAVPAHLLKPWQAAQGCGDSVAMEVVVAAPVVEMLQTPEAAERTLTPVWEPPVQPALAATVQPTPCTEAETKDFLPLAAAVVPSGAAPAPEADSTVKRLRERLTSGRQRLSRVAQALRTERDSASAQAYELELLRGGMAAVTTERDELRLSNQQLEELHRELVGMQTELEALERQCEELRTAPASELATATEVAPPVDALEAYASDPWAEFTLDSTPEPNATQSPTLEPEPQISASFNGWKTDPQPDVALVDASPAASQQEESEPQSAGLWEVESACSATDAARQPLEGKSSPVDVWGAAEESAFPANAEYAESSSEPNRDDMCPDPFGEEASDWSPPVDSRPFALSDSTSAEPSAADSWSLADALQSPAPLAASNALGTSPEELSALASAEAIVVEQPLSTAAEEPMELPAAEAGHSEAEADGQHDADSEEHEEFAEPLPASEPKAISALFAPTPATPPPAASSPSFIERYAHLLEEDVPSEPLAPPTPAMTRPAPLDHSDEDESIDDYMERLLQRMRGESAPATVEQAVTRSAASASAPLAQPSASPVAPVKIEEYAPPEEPLTSLDELRRGGAAPERTTDMSALRALANQNARHNIGVAAVRQHKEFAFVKFGISVTVVGAGAVLALMAPDLLGVQMIGSCVAMLVAGYYAGRTARLLKEAVKTAKA